ncbi:MAG: hypothetical protein A2X08_08330 [Bacteroidetes bacterium GWA2_32_17]|nr:MAG: hypothetical protein A2X08_08330 [Bacteroidetes bacterium GWA2_32_17]
MVFKKGDSYLDAWKQVADFESKGLPQSALEMVEQIYTRAKKENNYAQIVKALLHKTKYALQTDENGTVNSILKLKAEADSAKFPLKPVLHSILGDFFWQYYSQNRYVIYQRTNTGAFRPDDIATWDAKKLIEESIKYYKLSLENIDSLQRTDLGLYDDILVLYPNARKYRPTLFDFLANRAIDFYMNSEAGITRPSYEFNLTDENLFLNEKDFINYKIQCKDSLSLKFQALITFQKLLDFHNNDNKKYALVDADLKRLKFIYNNSVISQKDSLYTISLLNLKEKFEADSVCADIIWNIGELYYQQGVTYQPNVNTKYKEYIKKSFSIAEEGIKKYPNTEGAVNCLALKNKILVKSFDFVVEKNQSPDKAILARLNYKNIDSLYFRIVRIDWLTDRKKTRNIYDSTLVSYYIKKIPVKTFSVGVPDSADYQDYSTEFAMPSMPIGQYFVIASNRKDFKWDKNEYGYAYFNVTNLSYLSRRFNNEKMDFIILNRQTGAPEQNVNAQLWKEDYSYILQAYDYYKSSSFITDANGKFSVPAPKDYRYFFVELTKGNDRLVTDESFYQYRYYGYDQKITPRIFFFTDRSIYRPGQTLYFKGIVINTDGTTNKIIPNFTTTVTLYDVNYQKVSDLKLTSNEYGSIQGTFTLPTGTLNGQMSISAGGYGTQYFSVEEYKRPKFEVAFDTLKETYKLNNKVKLSGQAKAYAGSSIDNATVSYRVSRKTYFPYRWWYWWSFPTLGSETVMTYGTTTTDADGKFNIEFEAKPDLNIDAKYSPAFTYSISADVTDINGETRSTSTSINVGYKSLVLGTNWYGNVNISETENIEINARNLNGNDVQASGKITIYKLNQPSKVYQTRGWSLPDVYKMSETEFNKLFPQFPYKNEENPVNWQKSKKVFESDFNSKISKKIKLDDIKGWEQGYYYVEINSKDNFGEDVKYQDYLVLYNPISNKMPYYANGWFTSIKNNCEPGEKAKFLIGSSELNSKILYEIEHKGKIVKSEWITLNNEQKLIEIPVAEEQRGNFSVHFTSVINNRSNNYYDLVTVPYSNKELDISFESFRNKLYPGEQEEWKILVKGKKGDKVAAEMVATLYDASLDAFRPQNWSLALYPGEYTNLYWSQGQSFANANSALAQVYFNEPAYYVTRYYDYLDMFGLQNYFYTRYSYYGYLDDGIRGGDMLMANEQSAKDAPAMADEKEAYKSRDLTTVSKVACDKNAEVTNLPAGSTGSVNRLEVGPPPPPPAGDLSNIKARKNFNETAFFFPNLKTNEKGEIIISFKVPEALTKWKMLGLAHTKDLRIGTVTNELVTQKELMVMPNLPRFIRENDKIIVTSKVSNLGENESIGEAQLFLFDAITNKPIDNIFGNKSAVLSFTVKKGQSTNLSWELNVPEGVDALTCKIVAKAGKFSDGEENVIPVLTNRMLVTESMPLPIRGISTKKFSFTKLLNSGSSSTLKHQKVTLEFTANPAWYAVQALPYIIEYPYECAEQVFSRYYGNKLASHIANSSPKIKAVFDSWKNTPDSKALLSNLEKNQELKDVLLQETPWVLDAKDETTRKHRIGLLFDLNNMSNNLNSAFNKLEKLQCSNGGFMWFPGMPDDRYITQHIVTGFAHLDHLGVINVNTDYKAWNMVQRGIRYLDNEMRKDYEWLKKHYTAKELAENHLSDIEIQYLYMRSYYTDKLEIQSNCKEGYNYFRGQAQKYWLEQNKYMQGMIALALHRTGDNTIPTKILASLKEFSLNNEEMGMYWKENDGGYYWWQAPIETQALLIEAYDEISGDQKAVDDMKVWLLKQKQTQDWKTTKATTEAIYALLLRGTDWLATEPNVEITVGSIKINPKNMPDQKAEAGTGYIKTSWTGSDIKSEMGNVTVVKKDEGVSWGSLYWQYFEQLDKITPHETPLKLNKKLFIEKMGMAGKSMDEVKQGTDIKVGDKVIVRIKLRVDREMQYVHMKDMRAAGFEPISVISTYKWQDGLGYYESTKDASTNFFFSYLPKGTYVFEYPVRATLAGDFSNGISSIQCMYAPEFTSHSEGIRVKIYFDRP